MIVKKIKNDPKSTKPKTWQITDLVDYIRNPHNVNPLEKIEYAGSRNFLAKTHAGQKIEMISLAKETVHSKMPVQHWLFSWKEGEQPTPQQIEQVIDIFLDDMGLKGHQTIFGLHNNTANYHLHIAVNRMNEDTMKVIVPHKGFDIEAGHRILAKIEHIQKWQSEDNTRYTVIENGEIVRANSDRLLKTVKPKAVEFEVATGNKSAIRIAQEIALPILKSAKSWNELHSKLESHNIFYKRKGSGAIVIVGDFTIKASSISRDSSIKNVVKRLGEFSEPEKLELTSNNDTLDNIDIIIDNAKDYTKDNVKDNVATKIKCKYDNLTNVISESKEEIENGNRRDSRTNNHKPNINKDERFSRKCMHRLSARNMAFSRNWESKSIAKRRQKRIKSILSGDARDSRKPYNFLRWNRTARPISKVCLPEWRQYHLEQEQYFIGASNSATASGKISFEDWLRNKGLNQKADEWRYKRVQNIIYNAKNSTQSIEVLGLTRDEIYDKLKKCIQNGWNDIAISGIDSFKRLCASISCELPIEVENPELQDIIFEEQSMLNQGGDANNKSVELTEFQKYHEAVNADKYRVTCIKMHENGEKKTFILDKQHGETIGFSPERLQQRLPEMLRIQNRGENIYYTPLSEDKHHILIDDMTEQSLKSIVEDGYQPAIILESSPNNFQCILTIPKLDTAHDRDVSNRITERLNRAYGDKKLLGCIHPHRAPGFQNRKPKHKREDDTFPTVKILKSEQCQCTKALELSKEIDMHYVKVATEKRTKYLQKINIPNSRQQLGNPVAAYMAHFDNIKQHMTIEDISRVDAMIALRMRSNGHSQDTVEQTIKRCAPEIRDKDERRNWDDYAKRTTAYAFGMAGDRDLERHSKYVEHWRRIEETEGSGDKRQRLK